MKFLGGVPQFYTQKFDDNGVLQTRKVTNGNRCNICHEFFLFSSVKTLRKIFLKRSAMFQKMGEIQYKPTLVESDQSNINSFVKSLCSSIFCSVMEPLHKSKYHIDLRIKLEGRFPKEKICPSGYTIFQVPVYDEFLNRFVYLYTKKTELREILYVCLLRGFVAKMFGNSSPKLLILA